MQSAEDVWFGRRGDPGNPEYFKGEAERVSIFDKSLTEDEIADLSNRAPVARNDSYAVGEDEVLAGDVSENDFDLDVDTLTYSLLSDSSNGGVVLDSDGSFTFTSASDSIASVEFTYEVSDGRAVDEASVSIAISPVNDAPTANDDVLLVNEDGTLSGSVGANDTDPDGDDLAFELVQPVSNGSLGFNPDGSFTYVPDENYFGADTFSYSVNDFATGIGADIGQQGDYFGLTTAVFGSTLVVGAQNSDLAGLNAGAVYVFEQTSNGWTNTDVLTASDASAGARFGASVAIDGDNLAIGAYLDDSGAVDAGVAYIFEKGASGWSESQKLVAPDRAANDRFGLGIGLDGDTLAIGALGDNSSTGAAYVFTSQSGSWQFSQKLTAEADADSGDKFGLAVDVEGNTIAVGNFEDDIGNGANEEQGAVYVFVNQNETWVRQARLLSDDASVGDRLGTTVEISGDRIIAGANGDDEQGTDSGAAYVFVRSGNSWTQEAKLTAESFSEVGAAFGRSVAIDGDLAVIGAQAEDAAGVDSGAAYVFERDGSSWIRTNRIVAPNADAGDLFAADESITLQGDRVFIGAFNANINTQDSGGVFQFNLNPGTDTATVNLTVNPVNDAPLARDDEFTLEEDTTLTGSVGSNDEDIDGDELTFVLLTDSSNGGVVLDPDGTFMFTPAANSTETVLFTYEVSDGDLTNEATVGISVTPANDAPVAIDDQTSTIEDTPVSVSVLPNDSDPDGDDLKVVGVTQPAHGLATINADGSITYTPDTHFSGSDTFTYSIDDFITTTQATDGFAGDAHGFALASHGNILVVGAPNAVNNGGVSSGAAYVYERSGGVWNLATKLQAIGGEAGDEFGISVDVDDDVIVVGANRDDDLGSLSGSVFVFRRIGGQWQETEKLTAPDGEADAYFGRSVLVQGNEIVAGAYRDDVAGANSGAAYVYTNDGTSWNYSQKLVAAEVGADDRFARATAIDGNWLVLGANKRDSGGASNSGAAYVYRRDGGSWVQFQELTAGIESKTEARFGISVAIEGERIVVGARNEDVAGVTSGGAAYVFDLENENWVLKQRITANTAEPQGRFGYSVGLDGERVYIASRSDAGLAAETQKLHEFAENSGIWSEQQVVDVSMASEANPDDDRLLVVNGVAFFGTPDASGSGAYHRINLSPESATATVVVTVEADADAPNLSVLDASGNQDTAIPLDVFASLVDLDGSETLSVSISDVPMAATLSAGTNNLDGSYTLQPSELVGLTVTPPLGSTSDFTLVVTANATETGNGDTESTSAALVVDVAELNIAPIAEDDSFVLQEDTEFSGDVGTNDSDPNGDTLSFAILTNPTNGSVVLNSDGTFTYTANENFNGIDGFSYTASDNIVSVVATVSLVVDPLNDAPVAVDDTRIAQEDELLTGNVSVNDFDVDGDALTYTLLTDSSNGGVLLDLDGTFTFTPTANSTDAIEFTYEVSDGSLTDQATVTISVTPVNDAPIAADDAETTLEDQAMPVPVLSNDSDPDGDDLSVSIVVQPVNGSVTIDTDGVVTYVPESNFFGVDSFVYSVADPDGLIDTATATIQVESVNDAPLANDDLSFVQSGESITIDVLENDFDVEDGLDVATVEIVSQPSFGSLSVNSDGTITYLNSGNAASDTFQYRVADVDGAFSNVATVGLSIEADSDVVVELVGSLLRIRGTELADTIVAEFTGGQIVVSVAQPNGNLDYSFDAALIDEFDVRLREGDDSIDLSTVAVPTTVRGGSGNDNIIGGTNDDILRGGAGEDVIFGGSGEDEIIGGADDDLLDGGDGDDFIRGGGGQDEVVGGDGDDQLQGNGGDDTIDGGSGNDIIEGQSGDDLIDAGVGDDVVTSGSGSDLVRAGAGNDFVRGGGGDDLLFGEAGNDFVLAGGGADILVGGNGFDWLDAGSGRDFLIGGNNSDLLQGRGGDDILIAGMTSYDDDEVSLGAIRAEWTSNRDYPDRVANLSGLGSGLRVNGTVFLTYSGSGQTVFDDGSVDVVFGQAGRDWFFYDPEDIDDQRLTEIFANDLGDLL